MTIQAPAKVNLVLRILAKRPDGYHDIETLMAPVSLSDELEIEISQGTGIHLDCDHPDIPLDATNLVWQAIELFARTTGLSFQVRVGLKKNIPHGAGLGGGSSDAAAVLKVLDQILETHLGFQKLEELAGELGSDIPFFIRCRPALCCGRGELMQDAGEIEPARILLVKPPFPVSTREAYQACSAGKPRKTPIGKSQFHGRVELINDLEEPVFRKFVLLPVLKTWLLEQDEVSAAMMSGSGSTIFAILHNSAGSLEQRVKEEFGPGLWTCETSLSAAH